MYHIENKIPRNLIGYRELLSDSSTGAIHVPLGMTILFFYIIERRDFKACEILKYRSYLLVMRILRMSITQKLPFYLF